jgi:glycosyltransferase involved in cell wall biosynthesis
MKQNSDLTDIYRELMGDDPFTVLVAPPIRYSYKKSDYLYLYYQKILKESKIPISNISTLAHVKLLFWNLFGRRSILHYHWFEISGPLSILSAIYKIVFISLYKLLGGNIVWSVKNTMPPDCRFEWMNNHARRWLADKADLLLVECDAVIADISTFFSVHPSSIRVVGHPSYPAQMLPRAAALEAINYRFNVGLNIQDRLFLMFGHISAYKQISSVCDIFMNEPVQKKLIIVGPVKKGQMKLYKSLKKTASKTKNIILIPQFINEESVPEFMNAADCLIFNHRDSLSQGVVHLAISYQKTAFLPKKGCLKELNSENLSFFTSQKELEQLIKQH